MKPRQQDKKTHENKHSLAYDMLQDSADLKMPIHTHVLKIFIH